MYTFFYKDRDGQARVSGGFVFRRAASGKIPAAKYQDKIVLIGATAAGLGTAQVTPVSPAMRAGADARAFGVEHPAGAFLRGADLGHAGSRRRVFLLVALYLIVLLPRLKAGMARAC